ncbi:hypothetical protein DEO45_10600 [Rhodanobacter denitrificans]|uniref:Uncharacterized protein n=1 Tax=Rhodanobacter denitrificans TaxID=666685 RepID=A0A368KF18_9GAMM|nr:hypothetical protein [Rhodanobacter denitrificans]RCS29605.1 hypothetical protein DEO45_10600 [Rhodanobacter denitrificans]
MEQIKCIIVGGPQHGLVLCHPWDRRRPAPLCVTADDGEPCVVAARRHDRSMRPHYLLLHPRATGEQILTMLAA